MTASDDRCPWCAHHWAHHTRPGGCTARDCGCSCARHVAAAGHVHGGWCHPDADACPEDHR